MNTKNINFIYNNRQISFSNLQNSKGELILVDIMGKCVFHKSFSVQEVVVQIPNINAGNYLVKLNFGNAFYTQKIRIE